MLPKKETLKIEFKSDVNKYPYAEIFEVVVALANTEGGDLYLGIEDDGEVTGVHKQHKNPLTLSAFIANNTIPPVSTRSEIIQDKFPVLKISVAKARSNIVATLSGKVLRRRLKADGTPENIPMYPAEFTSRLSDLRTMDYSTMPIYESSIDDFDDIEIEKLKNIILTYNGETTLLELNNEELFKALGFVREDRGEIYPTVTGILFLGKIKAIKQYLPTHRVSFQVLQGTTIKVNEDFVLPLISSIEKLYTYLEVWNAEKELEVGLFRISVPDFNKSALREAIVNAFSHRDYTKLGRVRIMLNDEGLTVANPGAFIEGVTIDNLLRAEPYGRNPHLSDTFKRLGLAERTGRGIDRIFEGSLLYGKPLPDYTESNSVNVVLCIPKSNPDPQLVKIISNEENRMGRKPSLNNLLVLNKLKDFPRASLQQIVEEVKIPKAIVKTILDNAIDAGIVECYGSGRSRTYILSPKVYSTSAGKKSYVRQVDINEIRYKELVINLAKNNVFIGRSDVVELLHINNNKAYRLLRKLVEENILVRKNSGRYAKYQLKET